MAAWTLIPDKLDGEDAPAPRFGAFLTTLVAFFLVEMGDKTQVATIALGARFHDVIAVTAGTTLGMMIANVPAIFLGHELLKRVDLGKVRLVAAALFLAIGLWVPPPAARSEEHTSELQSLMRTSYALLCLKKKTISETPIIMMISYPFLSLTKNKITSKYIHTYTRNIHISFSITSYKCHSMTQ